MQVSIETKTNGFFGFLIKASPLTQITMVWLLQVLVLNIVMLGAVYFAIQLKEFHPEVAAQPQSQANIFPHIWARYDSNYYLKIANEGYSRYNLYGFFPAYPIAINLVSALGIDQHLGAYLISAVSWMIALQMFYRTALLLRPQHNYAFRSTLLFAFVPTAFFFQAIYAEGLFIAFAVTATYFILSRRWLLAGLFVGLATVTRPIGWLWGVMLLVEFISARDFSIKALLRFLSSGIIALLGIVAYVFYIAQISGSYTAILQSQAGWQRSWGLPFMIFLEGVAVIFNLSALRANWFLYVTNLYDTFFSLVGIWFTAFAQKVIKRWSITIFLIVSMCFLLSSRGPTPENPLWGTSRWVPQLFPLFFVFGGVELKPRTFRLILGVSVLWLVVFAAWWATGRWVA